MGSLRNTDFGVFWASWVPGTGSGNWFREPDRLCGSGFRWVPTGFAVPRFRVHEVSKVSTFDGFRQVRFCSRGLDGTGSGNRVLATRGIEKVPGSGESVPKVPKVALYFESILPYFESLLFLIDSKNLHFESILLYFESLLFLIDSKIWHFESILLYFERVLYTLKVYCCTLKVYFCTLSQCLLMLTSGYIENQYSKGKEKVVINVHFIMQSSLLLGMPPTLI